MMTETRSPVLSVALCGGAKTPSRVGVSFMETQFSLEKSPCLRRPRRSDPADRKAVLARALLRNAFHVLCPDVDPGTEHRAKLTQQRLFGCGTEVARTHHVQHDLVNGRLYHLHLLEARYRGKCALHQRHPRNHRPVTALEIVGDASDDTLHERQGASTRAASVR